MIRPPPGSNRPDTLFPTRRSSDLRNPLDPRGGGKQPRADQEAYPEPERKRQMADAQQQEAETQQPCTGGKAKDKQHSHYRQAGEEREPKDRKSTRLNSSH